MDWAAAFGSFFMVVAMILEAAARQKQARKENRDAENIQTMRRALNGHGDINAVAADQHDRVLQELGGSERGRRGEGEEKRA